MSYKVSRNLFQKKQGRSPKVHFLALVSDCTFYYVKKTFVISYVYIYTRYCAAQVFRKPLHYSCFSLTFYVSGIIFYQ